MIHTPLGPIAHIIGEDGLQSRHLGRREGDRVVEGVDRLQLALQDVVGNRSPGYIVEVAYPQTAAGLVRN